MSAEARVQQAIDLKQLMLPPDLRVLSIDADDYTDWSGDPALRLSVLIDENTDVEHLSGDTIHAFKRAVRESLRRHGIDRFAYFFFAKPSELADSSED